MFGGHPDFGTGVLRRGPSSPRAFRPYEEQENQAAADTAAIRGSQTHRSKQQKQTAKRWQPDNARYPFAHIHPDQHQRPHTARGRDRSSSKERKGSAVRLSSAERREERLKGMVIDERVHPKPGPPQPHHRRFDFSRPKQTVFEQGRPASALVGPPQDPIDADPIRVHPPKGSRVTRMQSETNDPFSSFASVRLEKYAAAPEPEVTAFGGGSTIQPHLSARYIQQSTEQKLQAQAEQVERYHREVKERLAKRIAKMKKEEEARKAALPVKVQTLVYERAPNAEALVAQERERSMQAQAQAAADEAAALQLRPLHELEASEQQTGGQGSDSSVAGGDALNLQSYHPHPATSTRAGSPVPAHAHEQRDRMSREEEKMFMARVRKEEMERERMEARRMREMMQQQGSMSARSHRRSTSPTSSAALQAAVDGLLRRPDAFSVRQQTTQCLSPSPPRQVLYLPEHGRRGGRTRSRSPPAAATGSSSARDRSARSNGGGGNGGTGGTGGTGRGEKHSVYRRHLLERLHALSQQMSLPLPPLCACGFTPAEEYALLFSYGGVASAPPGLGATSSSVAPPPFNHSTSITPQPHPSSIHAPHTHTHHGCSAASSTTTTTASAAGLPVHVILDASRHGFQHKYNCTYHNQPENYIKAMAQLLQNLEEQAQI